MLRKSAFDWLALFFSAATAVGLVGTLIFTARSFFIAAETLRLTQESSLIGAYAKAAEQLTSSEESMAKFSALYMLSRVASSSREYHAQVIPTLCTFIRRNAPVAGTDPPPQEVQSAVDVIGGRVASWDNQALNLSRSNLSNLNFDAGDFAGANFSGCDLTGADLSSARLSKSWFTHAQLGNANFSEADLLDCDFTGATFQGSPFQGARVRGTNFRDATGFIRGPRKMFAVARNIGAGLEIRE
jgi:hypothetical protein